MNRIKRLSLSNSIIISLALIASTSAYVYVANLAPINILYAILLVAGINFIIFIPRIIVSVIILVIQLIFTSALTYSITTITTPEIAALITLIIVFINLLGAVLIYYKASGRLWLNLIIAFLLLDINLSIFLIKQSMEDKVLYALLAIATPAVILVFKTVIINRKIINPIFPTKTNNSVLSKKISKLLDAEKIEYNNNYDFISRTINVGNKTLATYEPAVLESTRITKDGLYIGEQNYSAYLEHLIKTSKNNIKETKNVMPIIILNDQSGSKILKINVYSRTKPDRKIGTAYATSPTGLVELAKNINNASS